MSGTGPKSEPTPIPQSRAPQAPAESRPGFLTMPTELRAFQRPDPNAGVLAAAEVAAAADKLREAGRGPDILFEDLRASPPREPSANDNRAEHLVVNVPASASPWAKEAAAVEIDKSALPSASAPAATAPSSRPPPGVAAEVAPKSSAKATTSTKAATSTSKNKQNRRGPLVWVVLLFAVAAIAVVMVVAQEDPRDPVASTPAGATTEATGSLPVATTDPRATATGAPVTTGAATIATAQLPTARTASTASSAGTASVTRPVPKLSGDPYMDAGALPKATGEPAPTAPTVVTAPSTAPTAPPATATSSATPSATSPSLWFPKSK